MSTSPSLPSSSNTTVDDLLKSPNESGALVRVRFDDECVLIPDPVSPSIIPRIVKRSYCLPLWKKRGMPVEGDVSNGGTSPLVEETAISITLPIPQFARARSPTRHDSHHHHHRPLVPCIVDHQHPRRARRPSEPLPPPLDVTTVPLRACCEGCYLITEECLKEGDAWQEKFSRGARRLRSLSTDSHFSSKPSKRSVCKDVPGFDVMLNVDEVDIMHKTSHHTTEDSQADPPHNEDETEVELGLLPSLSRHSRKGTCPVINDLAGTFSANLALDGGVQDAQLTSLPPTPLANAPSDQSDLGAAPKNELSTPTLNPPLDSPALSSSSSSSTPSDLLNTPPRSLNNPPINIPGSSTPPPPPSSFSPFIPSVAESPSFITSPSMAVSPKSSPKVRTRTSTSPNIHSRTASSPPSSPGSGWRRPYLHIPKAGSFIKASVEVLKGVNTIGGAPTMAV